MADHAFQISGKAGNPAEGILYLARGDNDLETVTAFMSLRDMLNDQLGTQPHVEAVQAVRTAFPQAQVESSQGGNSAPVCVHGPMAYKSGQGAKGPWGGYFCGNGRNSGCEVIWDKKGR